MWRWLTEMFAGKNTPTDTEGGDRLVSDKDYDFKVGTKAKLPEGMRDLKIAEVDGRILNLDNFDIELTVDQKFWDQTPEAIAMASRCLRWAKTYHGLAESPQAPVRLHRQNVVLMPSGFERSVEDDLVLWLCQFGWPQDRPVTLYQATTNRPLEDGFFTCARVTVGDVADESGLSWQPTDVATAAVVDVLADFVRREMTQPWGQHCESYLESCYAQIPREQLTHPVFALLHFPTFDMGIVETTFAGSVWSENEIRLWSRPTYYHK
jgi:hypothetical protein